MKHISNYVSLTYDSFKEKYRYWFGQPKIYLHQININTLKKSNMQEID